MASLLPWGILGTGNIAHAFAHGLTHSKTGRLVAVGSRSAETAVRFGESFGLPAAACHATYEALLADPAVQAVYISNPHPGHAEWAIKCAEAGKHILCEKPLAMNHAEGMAVVEAARRHDVFLMEAFMYRCHPQTLRLVELIREGAIGTVRVVQATFSFRAADDPRSRLLDLELGGGGILDVGCYPVSMSRLISGAATGQPFADPVEFQGVGHLGETGVDDYAVAVARFPGGMVAQLAAGVRVTQENVVRIYGDDGLIVVPVPWAPTRDGGSSILRIHRAGQAQPEEIRFETPENAVGYLYTLEADHVAAHIKARQSPAISWADSLGNLKTLDRWRAAIGMVYPLEKPDHPTAVVTVVKRPLQRRAEHRMRYGQVPGIDKPVSRLVLGCDNQSTYAHAAAIFDGFFEQGGNCFDTAWIYNEGLQERLLGQWLKNRPGMREQIVILAKGAHPPRCTPDAIAEQLAESLDRLGTGHVDLYVMHRDNRAVPVGEFVEALNDLRHAGRMRAFGGSNWTLERLQAANTYAVEHGLQPFTVLSDNLSLARMVDPVWNGCVSVSDPGSRAWLTRNQTALFAWSSQARGFFLDAPLTPGSMNGPNDAEVIRCWHSTDNFERRERAATLARQKGVGTLNIALAYVLNQPFPTFALIGPRTLEEIRTSLPGVDLPLTPGEIAWLNLERARL